jgi:two-component system chemotaxis response regulator CheB
MDGLEALREIRKSHPRLPVLIFSALTERAGELTLEALREGASDYITKPTSVGDAVNPVERVRAELLAKIKALVSRRAAAREAAIPALPVAAPRSRGLFPPAVELVVIGASTGGPNALEDLLIALPGDFPVPIAIAQHMPQPFTRLFAERLDQRTALRTREAEHGARPRAGEVWIAPGDYHLAVARDSEGLLLHLNQGPQENACRPAADVLFRSAVASCGSGVLAVVLTGMGCDGMRGCEGIRAAGGQVVVQDEASSVIWGMPGSVARAGLADAVLPLARIADALIDRVQLLFGRAVGAR